MDVAEQAVLLEDPDRRLPNQQMIAEGDSLRIALAADRFGVRPPRAATSGQRAGYAGRQRRRRVKAAGTAQ
jgi:predicted RNA polymerase sigma factor